MPLVRFIRPEMREIGGVYRGVLRGAAIGSGELKGLLARVQASAEILITKNQEEFEAKWPERLVLGQHFEGHTDACGDTVGHAYELRGRLFVQST